MAFVFPTFDPELLIINLKRVFFLPLCFFQLERSVSDCGKNYFGGQFYFLR